MTLAARCGRTADAGNVTLYLYEEYDEEADGYVTIGLPVNSSELESELRAMGKLSGLDWDTAADEDRHIVWSALATTYGIKRGALRARFCPVCGSTGPILCPTFGRLGERLLLCVLCYVQQLVERLFAPERLPGRYTT